MLVMQHAWPELNRLADYRREVLVTAAKALQKSDERYRDIQDRVKKDEKFAMVLRKLVSHFPPVSLNIYQDASQVMDRLAGIRGTVHLRGLDHIAVFQLGIGDACVQRVQALVTDDRYIYPGKWTTDEQGMVSS